MKKKKKKGSFLTILGALFRTTPTRTKSSGRGALSVSMAALILRLNTGIQLGGECSQVPNSIWDHSILYLIRVWSVELRRERWINATFRASLHFLWWIRSQTHPLQQISFSSFLCAERERETSEIKLWVQLQMGAIPSPYSGVYIVPQLLLWILSRCVAANKTTREGWQKLKKKPKTKQKLEKEESKKEKKIWDSQIKTRGCGSWLMFSQKVYSRRCVETPDSGDPGAAGSLWRTAPAHTGLLRF